MTNDPTDSHRLVPGQSFPPYSYVPGMHPHPIRDESGHSFSEEPDPIEVCSDSWHECEQFRRGIDLFHEGYYWEAHESWEAVWNAVGRAGRIADFLKGLIKLAAAGVKAREGNATGIRRHSQRARDLFEAIAADSEFSHGFVCEDLIGIAGSINRNATGLLDCTKCPVRRVWDHRLPEFTPRS